MAEPGSLSWFLYGITDKQNKMSLERESNLRSPKYEGMLSVLQRSKGRYGTNGL